MAQARSRELDVLADAGWLVDTPVRFRDAVLDRCLIHRYRKGDAVYRTGDPPGGLYGLIEGSVGVELSPHDRAPYIGTFARPGFWIGEGSVLTRGPRYIGIRATRDSLLAYLPIPQWDAVVQSEPDAWRWFGFLALRNTLLALSVVDALMISGAAERLAAILLVLSGEGLPTRTSAPISIDTSQEDLSRMACLSRSSTGRILQEFEAEGLITNAYREICVIDRAGLSRRRAKDRGTS